VQPVSTEHSVLNSVDVDVGVDVDVDVDVEVRLLLVRSSVTCEQPVSLLST